MESLTKGDVGDNARDYRRDKPTEHCDATPWRVLKSCGCEMKRINIYTFYVLGNAMRPLESVEEGSNYKDVWHELTSARNNIKNVIDNELIPLRTCRATAQKLINHITDVVPNDFNAAVEEISKNGKLNWSQAYYIKESAKEFRTILAAELQLVDTYSVSQKGSYSTPDLIDHAEITFSEEIRKRIPADSIRDIQQAGRCLAFDVPTAAAFHILRAAEGVVREYHEVVSKGAAKLKTRNWGVYIRSLTKLGADAKVLAALDQIRTMYRNPIIHPEDTVSLDEAMALFGVAQGAIFAMVEDIKKRKSGP